MASKETETSSNRIGMAWGGRRGVTLVELLAILFIVGLLILGASPFIKTMTLQGQASAVSRQVYTDLLRARSEAVRTKLPHLVELCGQMDAGVGNYHDAGYMVIECTADYAGSCATAAGYVCGEIANDTVVADPNVKMEVNLTKGMRTFEGQVTEARAYSAVRFGWDPAITMADRPTKGTPNSPRQTSPPRTFGVELPAGDMRFFFKPNGTVGDNTGGHAPGGGALYLRATTNKDPNYVRAVDFSAAGSMRVYRWDPTSGVWK